MTFTDQIGNKITLPSAPKRIISLVPSQSEFLWDIGLRNELIGISKFCVHPAEMHKALERIGGTKSLNLERIKQLHPDLIIGNKEENEKGQIKMLQKEFNVWMSDIYNFEDAFVMMRELGAILGREKLAANIIESAKVSLARIKNMFKGKSVAYFIWNQPYLFSANNTFIDYVLNYLGFRNVLGHYKRYPEITIGELKSIKPEFCFLSSEPFPFKEQHATELKKLLPDSKIVLVDGEMFSWYGSRLLKLEGYVSELGRQIGN